MQKSEIEVGKDYALRESRKPDALLQRVRILQFVRGKKWKAEWIEPTPASSTTSSLRASLFAGRITRRYGGTKNANVNFKNITSGTDIKSHPP
jgi:hypothetical protein